MTTDQTDLGTPEDETQNKPDAGPPPGTAVQTYRDPYDTAEPVTLRDRIIYARELANSGLLPRDYVGKPANVLVAAELGAQMGLAPIQAVLMLNVVEGRPSLGANGVRAVVANAGHHMGPAVLTYNKHGVPTEASVTGWRAGEEDRPVTIVWNLNRAARAGLVRLRRDDAGEVEEVTARSSQGKVLPWEAYTEDMLDARATTKLGRTLFGDVTMGLSYEREELADTPSYTAEVVAQTKAEPTARAQEVLQQTQPKRRTDLPDEYDPDADLEEAGPEWWIHAGAQVSRRNKQQLAADRIAKYMADNANDTTVPRPPEHTTSAARDESVVDGELLCDYPACALGQHDTGDHIDANGDVLVPEPEPEHPLATPEPAAEEVAPAEVAVEEVPEAAVAADPPADPTPGESMDDTPDLGGGSMTAPTAEELLDEIDKAAGRFGKTRQGLMVRWIATHRKNPEQATAEELLPFVESMRETIAQMQ